MKEVLGMLFRMGVRWWGLAALSGLLGLVYTLWGWKGIWAALGASIVATILFFLAIA